MPLFNVLQARIAADSFIVEAETAREAAQLVSNGKVREDNMDIPHGFNFVDEMTVVELPVKSGVVHRFDNGPSLFKKEEDAS